jgi:hypothetical protein
MIVGLMVLLINLPATMRVHIPLYLYGLLGMILLFFVAHGFSIAPARSAGPHPWWLPGGFIRGLLVIGIVGGVAWQVYSNPTLLLERLTPKPHQLENWPYELLALAAGFALGRLAQLALGGEVWWFQDILAWVALLAMLGLVIEVVLLVFVNPNLRQELDLTLWEDILTGVITFYFAARS